MVTVLPIVTAEAYIKFWCIHIPVYLYRVCYLYIPYVCIIHKYTYSQGFLCHLYYPVTQLGYI